MGHAAKPTRHNRTIPVDFQGGTASLRLLDDTKSTPHFLEWRRFAVGHGGGNSRRRAPYGQHKTGNATAQRATGRRVRGVVCALPMHSYCP